MERLIEGFTNQLRNALEMGQAVDIIRPGSDIRNVLITGMGGSGIGADIVESLTYGRLPIPAIVSKGYNIPQFVSLHTLFIACSYSGNTEETLAALQKALYKRAHIICITSGGKMLEFAKEYNLFWIKEPPGSLSPRAMIGYLIVFLLFALYHSNLIGSAFVKETENAIKTIERKSKELQAEGKRIAKQLKGKLPIIYSGNRMRPMAIRFQNQLNENAKQLAHVNVFPEMNHNEIEGWQFPKKIIQQVQVVYLHSDHEQTRVKSRMEICQPIFEKASSPAIEISGEGASLLEQFLYLIHLTDWISLYLAKENGVDPNSIDMINMLKAELVKKT